MPDWLIGAIVAGVPGILYAGGLHVRMARVEKDLEKCVRMEVHAVEQKALHDKIDRTVRLVEAIYDRMTGAPRRPGDTDPGFGQPNR